MDKKIINTQTVEILRKWAIGRDLRERKSIVKVEYIKLSDWNDDPIHFSGDDDYILIKNKKKIYDVNNFEVVKYWPIPKFHGTHLEIFSNDKRIFGAIAQDIEKWCRIYVFNISMKEIL